MKILPAKLERDINSCEEAQYNNTCAMLTDRQTVFEIFSFFKVNKTQEHVVNLNDLLNVELYNDFLKMFNHAWEETL